MNAVRAGHEPAHIALVQVGQGRGVLGHEVGQAVPTHVAALGGGSGVLGIGLGGRGEVELAGVDLVEHFLGLSLVGGLEQDVRGLLRAVVGAHVGFRALEHFLVRGLGSAFAHLLLQLLGHQRQRDVVAILVLGHAHGLEGLGPGTIRIIVATHGFHVLIDLGGIGGNALGLAALLHQLLVDEGVDDLLAHRLRRVIVVGEPLAPGVLLGEAHLGADVLDGLRDLVFGNLHPVDRGRDTARIGGRIAGLLGAPDDTQGAHSRQTNGSKRFRKRQLLHKHLPHRQRGRPRFNSRWRFETVPDKFKRHFPTHDGAVTTVAQFAHF